MATPKAQLLSRTVYDTNGTTTIWEFAFSGGYLDPSHVKAYTVNAIGARTDLVINPATDVVGQFQLRILPALAAGNELVIYRDTPKNLPLVDFTDESGFSEIALDTNAKQAVFIAAEAMDTANSLDVDTVIDAAVAASTAALAAQASQAAASGAADGAAISQSAANSSASAALAAQLAAESARNVAATEAAAAAVSATSANTSRTQAQASATAAQASATAAQASATAAAGSQTAAANSATAASSSATAAGSSASAANTSATASASAVALAQAQAVDAQNSAASAAASAASVNSANLVQVTGDQTIGGVKTFSNPIVGSTNTQVSLTGTQTIGGVKTFTSPIVASGGTITGTLIFGHSATSPNTHSIQFGDSTGWVLRYMTIVSGTPTERFRFVDTGHFTAVGNITAGGQFIGNGSVPPGAVMHFAMNAPPTGWLRANGAAVSRATFAALFAAIGTTYGAGDGSTTFNLPDLRGEFLRGWDDGRGVDSGRGFGSAQAGQNVAHGHAMEVWRNTSGSGVSNPTPTLLIGGGVDEQNSSPVWVETTTAAALGVVRIKSGQGGGTEARPRNVALLACIKF